MNFDHLRKLLATVMSVYRWQKAIYAHSRGDDWRANQLMQSVRLRGESGIRARLFRAKIRHRIEDYIGANEDYDFVLSTLPRLEGHADESDILYIRSYAEIYRNLCEAQQLGASVDEKQFTTCLLDDIEPDPELLELFPKGPERIC